MSGEKTYWRFEQALDFVVHRDISSVREAPSFFSERDWPSEVLEPFWSLWRALETGTVHSIEHGRTVPPLRWCNDRLALEEYEEAKGVIGLIHFIVIARGVTRDVSIPVADLLAAFPVPPAATPEVAKEAALPAQLLGKTEAFAAMWRESVTVTLGTQFCQSRLQLGSPYVRT